jgi:hypothetical protein
MEQQAVPQCEDVTVVCAHVSAMGALDVSNVPNSLVIFCQGGGIWAQKFGQNTGICSRSHTYHLRVRGRAAMYGDRSCIIRVGHF